VGDAATSRVGGMPGQAPAPRIVVVGSGSFARAVSYSLATELRGPAEVLVLARDPAKAAEVAFVSAARAGVSGVPAGFRGGTLDRGALDDVLGAARPEVLIHCVSQQSPWERSAAPSAWTRLVQTAGFGLTLPLQAALVLDVAESLSRVAPDCLLINACFPDAVNPVLGAHELPVFCGAGNIATLAACVQTALGRADQSGLNLLAHHANLHAPDDPADEARLWCDGVERQDVTELLRPMREADRAELNQIGGHAAARLAAGLLAEPDTEVATHLPGPLGLPGGYPVLVTAKRIELRLPHGIDAATAIDWNQGMAVHDGVQVRDGRVAFPSHTAETLRAHLPALADGYPVRDIRSAGEELLELRARLRAKP
jgi:hypothetical protein